MLKSTKSNNSDRSGLTEIAQSPTLVADAIIEAFKGNDFHVFPDSMAQQIGSAYQSFAENVVETNVSES